MASIQAAAEKSVKERKAVDNIRIKVGHMLTFDNLALDTGVMERQVARRIARKNQIRSAGCLSLPLTIVYFVAYVVAARLHEDITGVFLLESTIRRHIDDMFTSAQTLENVWDKLLDESPNGFLDVFFQHNDAYGEQQQINVTDKIYGDWGMVESYNQIQGAVRFQQSRSNTDDFGENFTCGDPISCELCRLNAGFQTIEKTTSRKPLDIDCGPLGANITVGGDPDGQARRLYLQQAELRASLPQTSGTNDDRFEFWLFPYETREQTVQRLRYYRDRNWLAKPSQEMEIRMYLMNAELGRTRLEQLSMTFRISTIGSVYYARDFQTIFLQFWQSNLSMLADGSFLVMLLATSAYRMWQGWKAFLNSKLFEHLMSLGTAWEWLMILVGWWNMYGFYKMRNWEKQVITALEPVHKQGWEVNYGDLSKVVELFNVCDVVSTGLAGLRVVFAQYSIVLMFRFFASFGTQPRLAVVLRTMQNILTDFYHFLIVFFPTFMAYVITGSLLFGRTIQAFSTIQSSFGACFRIAMESEYDWEDMSSEYFWAAAAWSWSFLLLVVLLFLNMVLAIILDIYNETRESSFPGEAIWETMGQFLARTWRYRSWVPDRALEHSLTTGLAEKGIITSQDIGEEFPNMPSRQFKYFFNAGKREMEWESAKDLTNKNLLKLTGHVVDALDGASKAVDSMTADGTDNPVGAWLRPQCPEKTLPEAGSMLFRPAMVKGCKQPGLAARQAGIGIPKMQEIPEWLQETWDLLNHQRTWIEYASWQLQVAQFQMQDLIDQQTSRQEDQIL